MTTDERLTLRDLLDDPQPWRITRQHYAPYSSSQSWTTADELRFIREMAAKGRFAVLRTALDWVNRRHWDGTVNVSVVRQALEAALEGGGPSV